MPADTHDKGLAPPVRLEIRLLGAVEVILDGQRLRAFDSLRLQRFLGLVALQREPQHRSRLAFELWPDSGERQARTNLRKLLHEFRHAFADAESFVAIDNETVQWLPAGPSHVDVLVFRDAISAGDLQLAARVYSGDLLPACYDDWVLEERARLHAEGHGVFLRLAEEAAERNEPKAAVRWAQRAIELEPTDESAVRLQMEAHLALADKPAALRCYHRCAEVLERELGVSPDEAIEELYRQLHAGGRQRVVGSPKALSAIAESPFIGREAEWQLLREAWGAAERGSAHIVLVTGEPGIGKSRLAQEFGRSLRSAGHSVASARAFAAAGRLPWGPVVDLLRSDALRRETERLDPVWKAELERLLPELGDAKGRSGIDHPGETVRRHRLFDAVRRAIVSQDRPRLLIVDDLQWCDTETIELLGYLVSSAQAAPILIVGTVRSEELPQKHSLHGLVDALSREGTVTRLSLGRFDQAVTAQLAARLRPEGAPEPEFEAKLWRETEGNPLFVIEALRAGFSADSGDAVLTPTMRAVLNARLAQLSDGARQLAEVAAVFGRPFPTGLMVSATGADETELVERLDELWRRRIIRDAGSNYDFTHDKLRAVTLEALSPARRRRLHRAIAEALAAELGDGLAAISPQLAAHYDQAGLVGPAVEAYRVAGGRAVAVSALDEAVAMFQRALMLIAELPGSPDRDKLELDIRLALGSPLVALEGYGSKSAHHLYERARALCRRLGLAAGPPILRGLGLAQLQGCRFDDCEELARALLDHESHDPITTTEGHYLLGVSAFWRGDLAESRANLGTAIRSYDDSHGQEHLTLYAQDPKAICQVRLAWIELWAGDPGGADDMVRAALKRALNLDHLMTWAYALTYAAIVAAESERYDRLAELLDDAKRLWERIRERYLIIVLDALRGWLAVHEGSSAGVERVVESVARSRQEGETLHLTYTLLLLARARGMLGEYHEARAAIREALQWTERCNQRYLEAEILRVDGELAYRCGDSGPARSALRRATEVAGMQEARWLELRARVSLVNHFPDAGSKRRLTELVGSLPSGQDLPAFRAARGVLGKAGG